MVSFAICVGCWLLGASVIVYGYSSIVVSSLTVAKALKTVNSLEDFLAPEHKDVLLLLRTDQFVGPYVMVE